MNDKPNRTRGLGRGLSALMADVAVSADAQGSDRARRADLSLPVERVHPNPDQPRRTFRDNDMEELAASIREKGIIQPLIVRAHPDLPDHYQIVAGERRWRAAQMAQLHEVPAILRRYSDTEVLEIAIIENIQRADLNPIDEGAGYRALMDRFGHTQDHLATALGKSRSHIANQMRLLTLPDAVQAMVVSGTLTAGHVRPLIGHPDALALAGRIAINKLTVRDAERLAKTPFGKAEPAHRMPVPKDADTIQIENDLSAALGMGVTIDQSPGAEGGKLVLRYRTLAQLDDLLRALSGG